MAFLKIYRIYIANRRVLSNSTIKGNSNNIYLTNFPKGSQITKAPSKLGMPELKTT